MYYIGLDVGTSGCKASVTDGHGNVIRHAHCEYSTTSPKPGHIEIDANVVYGGVKEVLIKVAGSDIAALAVSSFGEAMVFVGADGEVLAPSIYYTDARGNAESKKISSMIDAGRLMEITGLSPNPMYSASKLMWIKDNQPELIEKTEYIFLYMDYISWKLTGERIIDYSLASRTMMLDIYKKKWSDEVAEALGLSTSKFSSLAKAGTILSRIKPDIAKELGLPEDIEVIVGGHDQIFSALGGGAVKPGDSVDAMGSGDCLSLILDKSNIDPMMSKYRFCVEPFLFDDSFLTLAFNASAGTAITWYRDCFNAGREEEARHAAKTVYALMDSECPEEPTDILFLPYVAGSGTPYFDAEVGGILMGLRQGYTRAKIYKAVLEGICYEMRLNMEFLKECGLGISKLYCAGGGACSDTLMQLKADVLNQEVDVLKNWETGTIGLALVCAHAMGEVDDLVTTASKLVEVEKTFSPDPERAAFYDSRMSVYRDFYPMAAKLLSVESEL